MTNTKKFKALLKELNLSPADIAQITGHTEGSIKAMLSMPIQRWNKLTVYVYEQISEAHKYAYDAYTELLSEVAYDQTMANEELTEFLDKMEIQQHIKDEIIRLFKIQDTKKVKHLKEDIKFYKKQSN